MHDHHDIVRDQHDDIPLLKKLGPGVITGAADDDPSGIATYSQAGAQFGYGLLWSVLFTTPLMAGIQIVSARIGCVTGHGLAANIRDHYPKVLLYFIVALLLVANTINIAADLGAMGSALEILIGGERKVYVMFFALLMLVLAIFIPFPRYTPILKWLTLSLFAYVGTVFVVQVPWGAALRGALLPQLSFKPAYVSTVVAVMMLLAVRPDVMGPFVIKRRLRVLGWLATGVMAAAVVAMFATL